MSEYRYTLTRDLRNAHHGEVCWVMLNPSTATQEKDDLTISKVKRFSELSGHRFITVVNLFALRATQPKLLLEHPDPKGPLNAFTIKRAMAEADTVIFAWGSWWESVHISRRPPRLNVEKFARDLGHKPLCLGTTRSGAPRHPSRVGYATPLIPYKETT